MKVFIIISCLATIVASAAIDFSQIPPIHMLPEWQAAHPEMTKIFLAQGSGTGRIINGREAVAGQFPHQVFLNLRMLLGSGLCGGSLIHTQWVLTAAHCVDSTTLRGVDVGLGSIDRRNNAPGLIIVTGQSWTLHENYNPSTFHNDIALIQVPSVTLSDNIQVIALAGGSDTFAGQTATVSGWGRLSDTGSTANILNFVDTLVLVNDDCATIYGSDIIIDSTVCTVGASCNGDSGGPLILNNVQIGVVSFGASESCTNFPSGYGRVNSFRSWIAGITNDAVPA